tara:strand:- start:267 stop:695 length:429 start_codon:yes stop_codon:yes gene_type:complete
MIEKIINKKKLLSIIIRANYKSEGIKFFTPNDFSQQLGYMNRPKGYSIAPHNHNKVKREVLTTDETLIIKSGKVRIDFYDEKKKYLKSKILKKGDVILLVNGGHGFEMLEKTEIIEIKQGPYAHDKDKTRFESVKKNKIKIK